MTYKGVLFSFEFISQPACLGSRCNACLHAVAEALAQATDKGREKYLPQQ